MFRLVCLAARLRRMSLILPWPLRVPQVLWVLQGRPVLPEQLVLPARLARRVSPAVAAALALKARQARLAPRVRPALRAM